MEAEDYLMVRATHPKISESFKVSQHIEPLQNQEKIEEKYYKDIKNPTTNIDQWLLSNSYLV